MPEAPAAKTDNDLATRQRAPGAALVIGHGLRITGNLACESHLDIDGVVEGDVSARSVTVGPTGTVIGTLTADEVCVLGTMTGIVYGCRVALGPNAVMTGDLVHETLSIEAGAVFAGACRRPAAANLQKPLPRRPALLTAPASEAAPANARADKEIVPAE